MLDQVLRDRKRVGEHLQPPVAEEVHHLKCRAAGVHDDRIAVVAERHRRFGDRPLLLDVDGLADLERTPGDADELRRMQRLGAAAHAPQPPLKVQRGDVAPNRRFRRIGHGDQLADRDDRALLHGIQDELVALALVHPPLGTCSLLPTSIAAGTRRVNQFPSFSSIVRV
jgi:hypothetical protein